MGYMGFGLRKEEYTRKPKKVFSKEKELYGDNLENYPAKNQQKKLSQYLAEIEQIKNKRRFRSKISESILGMVMTVSIMVIIYVMVLYFVERA